MHGPSGSVIEKQLTGGNINGDYINLYLMKTADPSLQNNVAFIEPHSVRLNSGLSSQIILLDCIVVMVVCPHKST